MDEEERINDEILSKYNLYEYMDEIDIECLTSEVWYNALESIDYHNVFDMFGIDHDSTLNLDEQGLRLHPKYESAFADNPKRLKDINIRLNNEFLNTYAHMLEECAKEMVAEMEIFGDD